MPPRLLPICKRSPCIAFTRLPVAGLRARLHRLADSAPATVRSYPGTQWDWDIGPPDCLP